MPDQFGLANEWYAQLAEPVRTRPRFYFLDQFNRNAAWFGITTSPFLRDWYRPLTEPVRLRPPLPRGSYPYLLEIINYIEYRFALTEQGDTGVFTMAVYPPKNLARVTITEINAYPTRVTIREVKYTKGYS